MSSANLKNVLTGHQLFHFFNMKEKREYKEYMRSEDWQRYRKEQVEQSNGICDACHWPLGGVPHVHHESYDNFGHEGFEDTQVLHSKCHERKHPEMEEVNEND